MNVHAHLHDICVFSEMIPLTGDTLHSHDSRWLSLTCTLTQEAVLLALFFYFPFDRSSFLPPALGSFGLNKSLCKKQLPQAKWTSWITEEHGLMNFTLKLAEQPSPRNLYHIFIVATHIRRWERLYICQHFTVSIYHNHFTVKTQRPNVLHLWSLVALVITVTRHKIRSNPSRTYPTLNTETEIYIHVHGLRVPPVKGWWNTNIWTTPQAALDVFSQRLPEVIKPLILGNSLLHPAPHLLLSVG